MKRITVLLAEDHMIVRQGIRRMLELDPGLEVVAEAEDGRQAVAMALKLHPQVILMDIAMPQLNGLEATRQVLRALPATRILMLSAHNDEAYVASATEAGAVGFLFKQSSADEVGQAIHAILAGGTYFGSFRPRGAAEAKAAAGKAKAAAIRLTSRETEVLQLIAEGKANKQTALELGIGIKTVEKHREHLMKKLDLHDTAAITRYAIGAGIIESGVQLKVL